MTDDRNGGRGANIVMAFILGAIVVVVALLAWFIFSGGPLERPSPDIEITLPDVTLPEAPTNPLPAPSSPAPPSSPRPGPVAAT